MEVLLNDNSSATFTNASLTNWTDPDGTSSTTDSARDWHGFTRRLAVYTVYVLVAFGILNNLIVLAVLLRKSFRSTSTHVYLRALAVFDILSLVLTVVSFKRTKLNCFLHDYFFVFVLSMSNWLLVCVTVERVIAILFPFKARRILTVKSAYIVITVLGICWLILETHDFFLFDKEALFYECIIIFIDEEAKRIKNIFIVINALKFIYIPFPVICLGNTCIFVHLYRHRKKLKKMMKGKSLKKKGDKSVDTHKDPNGIYVIGTVATQQEQKNEKNYESNYENEKKNESQKVQEENNKNDRENNRENDQENNRENFRNNKVERNTGEQLTGNVKGQNALKQKDNTELNSVAQMVRKKRERRLMKLLLGLNFLFLMTRFPYEVFLRVADLTDPAEARKVYIFGLVSILNNVLNVFFYVLSGSEFRKEFFDFLKETRMLILGLCCSICKRRDE